MTVERGTCPRCDSGEVVYLLFGMPASADFYDDLEPWQRHQGCLVPDHDRVCQTCDHRWQAQEG